MKSRKSWREKMNNPNLPKLVPIPPKMQQRLGSGTLLLPGPYDVQAFIRSVPNGSLTTVSRMREFLAKKFLADVACPLLTGLFVRIVAEAAEEEALAGVAEITPYWRVVRDDGSLNPKLPGGIARQAARLRAEGHRILPGAGRRPPRVRLVPADSF